MKNTPVTPLAVPALVAFAMLGCGRTKGYELLGRRELDGIKLGRKLLVTRASIERLLARLPHASIAPSARDRRKCAAETERETGQ